MFHCYSSSFIRLATQSTQHSSSMELCAVCLTILRINLIHRKKHKHFMKSLVRTVTNPILVKPAAPLEWDLTEHQKEVQKLESLHYTRSTRKASVTEQHKSAITDHVATTNHFINWEEAKVIDREADKCTRWLKEAIWIRRRGQQTLNKDEGAYKLHNIFDQLILSTPSTGTSRKYKGAVLSGLSCQSDEAARVAVKRH